MGVEFSGGSTPLSKTTALGFSNTPINLRVTPLKPNHTLSSCSPLHSAYCTELTFKEQSLEVPTKTMVQDVKGETTVVTKIRVGLRDFRWPVGLGGGEV